MLQLHLLDNIDQKINAVWNINDENKKNVGTISESIGSLAGISEEISSSMNVLETQVSCIEDQCSNLSNDAELLTVINVIQKTIGKSILLHSLLTKNLKVTAAELCYNTGNSDLDVDMVYAYAGGYIQRTRLA